MSDRRSVIHAIYTNASGEARGRGFRTITVPPDALVGWPPEDRRRLEHWLAGLWPIRGTDGAGLAANCLRIGGALRACLIRSVPGFERDAHGRGGGRLLHAILVPVEEWTDRCLHHQALLAAVTPSGAVGVSGDLDGYVEGCRRADTVECPPLDTALLGALLRDNCPALAAFLATSLARSGRSEVSLPVRERDLPKLLAGSVAALPPRLRLAVRWTSGLEGGGDGFVRVVADEGATAPVASPKVAGYLDRLAALLAAGRTAIAEDWLHDWRIRSWGDLMRRVEEKGA